MEFLTDSEDESLDLGAETDTILLQHGPVFFYGEFNIDRRSEEIYDTYFDPSGWGKVKKHFFFFFGLSSVKSYIFYLFLHISGSVVYKWV